MCSLASYLPRSVVLTDALERKLRPSRRCGAGKVVVFNTCAVRYCLKYTTEDIWTYHLIKSSIVYKRRALDNARLEKWSAKEERENHRPLTAVEIMPKIIKSSFIVSCCIKLLLRLAYLRMGYIYRQPSKTEFKKDGFD